MEKRTEAKHAGIGLEGQDRTFSSGVIGPAHASMRLLDPGNATELEQFEQAFFRGFRQSSHNQLIRWLWEWDEPRQRLRTRVPYEDQKIWVGGSGDNLAVGIAVNVRLALLQSAAFGFSIPDSLSEGRRICEFLAFFSMGDHSLANGHAIWTEVFRALQGVGYCEAVATAAPKVLPLYRRMGATILDEREVEGEKRFFLRFELIRTARWTARLDERATGPAPLADNPDDALSQATHELGVLLARLLPVMDLARGEVDRSFGIAARAKGAHRIVEATRARLALATAEPRLAFAARLRGQQLEHLNALWQAIEPFAELIAECSGTHAINLVEALEAILLTAIDAWEGDRESVHTLDLLMSADRHAALERVLAANQAHGGAPDRLAVAIGHFDAALGALKIFSKSLS
jgi:hypothetical protein